MDSNYVSSLILKEFKYEPTNGQRELIDRLADFIIDKDQHKLFVLKGYAGTGKTTIVSSLVKILPKIKGKSVLLAPTGRAAKVLSSYAEKQAFTIHKRIYFIHSKEGNIAMSLQKNLFKNTIFIIDEASMIPGNNQNSNELFSKTNLLDDLMNYVYEGENCKMIFVGDTAQLPPVGLDISPALDIDILNSSYSLNIDDFELKEVVRQDKKSGILDNATSIREKILIENAETPFFGLKEFNDIVKLNGLDFQDVLQDAFSDSMENNIIITRSNKRANIYNNEIRRRILFMEDELTSGDLLMVVRNNYFWLPEKAKAGFIANGDIIEVIKIKRIEELYGFRFADVQVRMLDYPDEEDLEVKIMLDTLNSETAALPYEDSKKLFASIMEDYAEDPKYKRFKKVKENPYLNALQVKFSYALTCHKTQGGQWENVFVDQGYVTDEMMNVEFMRWLYTAITRATKKLYLVHFKEEFFD